MIKTVSILLALLVTSLYLFPFELTFFPGVNSKMILALLGCLLFFQKTLYQRETNINRRTVLLLICASMVSLAGIFSVVYNNTSDYAYATYLLSMLVWMSAAYFVCRMIGFIHEGCSIRLICNYMVVVCVVQCLLAIYIDQSPSFKQLVDTYIQQGQAFFNEKNVKRLYGIGASLDVAGSRFAVALIAAMLLIVTPLNAKRWYHYVFYFLAFIIIGVIGNMVARTTLIGVVLSLGYLIVVTLGHLKNLKAKKLVTWRWLIIVLLICLPVVSYFYQTNLSIHKNLRFGFEGFFSLVEKGRWEVSSNERLKTMYVYPQSMKTWLIGDGYFSNPADTDPNFIGQRTGGYYMGTDVGYLRFIFYFGLTGLMAFCLFIILFGQSCIKKYPEYKQLLVMIVGVNFIIWLKVSTDIFLILALFFCAGESVEKEDCSLLKNKEII